MNSAIGNRVSRLEQAIGILCEAPEVVMENVLFGQTDPIELAIERHYQKGVLIYDSLAELLKEISGKTRSL